MKQSLMILMIGLTACQSSRNQALYESDRFTLYPDKVIQGKNEAVVHSPTHISSNYKSPASESFSRLVSFKFSINQKDNEARPGQDHWVLIGDEHESPVMVFGSLSDPKPAKPENSLPVNYAYTFRVDMSPVIRQFEEKGFYEAYDGTRIARSDFKGFYIAGDAEPLTWDFVNLDNQGLKLSDSGKDHIYTISLVLNPYDAEDYREKEWKLSLDLSQKPSYTSDQPVVDALFNLSLEEALKNIEPDSTFRTGAKWSGVWTRDISYSIFLAMAYHEPEVAKISLMKKVKRERIVQDTGSGGAWPVSSDRSVWALAAWEIYRVTGDRNWLRKAFTILKNTAEDDEKVLLSAETGMYLGESSFLDWREQTYPKWMSNADIYVSQNLGTNVVHYQSLMILAEMAAELGEPGADYRGQAERIKEGINQHLWMDDKGYYGQYLYGRPDLMLSPRFEALGEALAVLFEVADPAQAKQIFERSPLTEFGVTCIYPQIPGIPPYHNNGIWPFVQSYWNLAAAKTGNEQALTHGLAAIYRAGALFLTNYENFVAGSGDFMGTEINSDRMLWSIAGNLAMVHRVLIGMNFEKEGIRFQPVIPASYGGPKKLSNFRYREAILDISVEGHGNQIKHLTLDGEKLENAFFPAHISGKHAIHIVMADNDFSSRIQLVSNVFSLPEPQLKLSGTTLSWEPVPDAKTYVIYQNGREIARSTSTTYEVPRDRTASYQVLAESSPGLSSFASEPLWVIPENKIQLIEIEDIATKSSLPFEGFSGKGFVEITHTQNRSIRIPVTIPENGKYQLDLRYSNGSGPWNTDNKCALRSLSVNDTYVGTWVFPQRGTDEWSDWGYSNGLILNLEAGAHTLVISLEAWNKNMNTEVNRAMLDHLRIIALE